MSSSSLLVQSVMSKSVRPKDLTGKFSFGLTKKNISAAYFIVRTDKMFKISPNDWHVQKDFNISASTCSYAPFDLDINTSKLPDLDMSTVFTHITFISFIPPDFKIHLLSSVVIFISIRVSVLVYISVLDLNIHLI